MGKPWHEHGLMTDEHPPRCEQVPRVGSVSAGGPCTVHRCSALALVENCPTWHGRKPDATQLAKVSGGCLSGNVEGFCGGIRMLSSNTYEQSLNAADQAA